MSKLRRTVCVGIFPINGFYSFKVHFISQVAVTSTEVAAVVDEEAVMGAVIHEGVAEVVVDPQEADSVERRSKTGFSVVYRKGLNE